MTDAKPPKSKDELRAALTAARFLQGKVSDDQINAFVESVHYRDGGLGHMDYRPIKEALSADEFSELLKLLGITSRMFSLYDQAVCAIAGQGQENCIRGDTYCNPEFCHK